MPTIDPMQTCNACDLFCPDGISEGAGYCEGCQAHTEGKTCKHCETRAAQPSAAGYCYECETALFNPDPDA